MSANALALPPIEAKTFKADLERKSTSGKVLLMKSSGPLPGVGQLVLLRDDSGPVVALRTRKLYAERQFAGQIVKEYGEAPVLTAGQTYAASIKIRDLVLDEEDISELPPQDLDLELDRGRNAVLSEEEELELRSLVVEEIADYEQERSYLAYRLSLIRLPAYEKGFLFPAASGFRYSHTLIHPFLFSGRVQDALGFDLSLMFTKLNEYTPAGGDAFALLPMTFAGKYTVYPSEGFGVTGYLGFFRSNVIASKGQDPEYSEALFLLSYVQPIVGVGLSFEVGPQWWLQFELGSDQLGANLGVRF
jgi:hypothetical protein